MALQNRPLRPFEKGAHLHVLDWAHETARYRLKDAGRAQVRAAAKAIAKRKAPAPPRLPALAAAMTGELRKLHALGHATVRSELDAQRSRRPLSIGLSAAPAPPNLRKAKAKKGKSPSCGTCKMFDARTGVCWGYGNHPVKPNQLCDSYSPERGPKQLAGNEPEPPEGDAMMQDDSAGEPAPPEHLEKRGRLISEAVALAIHQAIANAEMSGISDQRRLRQLGEEAGDAALKAQASLHAGGAIGAGRSLGATTFGGVIGARYTSVLDKNTCGPCAEADDGTLYALDDPRLAPAPNPDCLGGPRCRCIWVYQLKAEGDQHGDLSSDELRMIRARAEAGG